MAFSPDGQRVASGGSDGAVMIWPANGRGVPIKLPGHDHSEVWSVTFSLDGQSVASTGQDSTVRIQRIDGDGTPRVIRGGPGLVWSIAISPDGRQLATAGADGTPANPVPARREGTGGAARPWRVCRAGRVPP